MRLMTEADLPFADQVRACAGWNQTPDDWRLLLEWQPDGCFVGELDGVPAGTATTIFYGTALAWIGMVLVHPDHRRHGVGHALLDHCIAFLRERRIQSIKLDATPLGKTLYDQLGFLDEWTLTRWEIASAPALSQPTDDIVRSLRDEDWPQLLALDDAAFGVPRHRVLRGLAYRSHRGVVSTDRQGNVDGFGFLRSGARAMYIGPLMASNAEAGLALMRALLGGAQGSPVYLNIPDQNVAAVNFLQQAGFARQRPFVRMFLGDNPTPGTPLCQYSIADPAIG
jgi:GNAT superfamily N-acetyltransferase